MLFSIPNLTPPPSAATTKAFPPPPSRLSLGGSGLAIECSSRLQKKAAKHHMKSRPCKSRPSDIRHGPAVYHPLPPEWTLVSDDSAAAPIPSQPSVQSE